MTQFLAGKGFTYAIIGMYALRCTSYAWSGCWARAFYWVCAIGITVTAEFLIRGDT